MQAAFGSVVITPAVGTHKIGWLKDIVGDTLLDPLAARFAIFTDHDTGVAIIQLDTLCVRWTQTNDIRTRIEQQFGFPGRNVMVTATHNHCGPPMANVGDVPRDDAYIERLVTSVVAAFGEMLARAQDAELAFVHGKEYSLTHNRRVVWRDGLVRTHGNPLDPNALCIEGPIDPELAVLAARTTAGKPLGCLVNFSSHPTHHGGGTAFTAGYPGVVVRAVEAAGWPTALYVNGASGNLAAGDPSRHYAPSMEEFGGRIAQRAIELLTDAEFHADWPLAGVAETVQLPYRRYSEDEAKGVIKGAQRFVDPGAYDRGMPGLRARIAERGTQPAEVQALFVGDLAWVAIPAEYFTEFGLRIKQEAAPEHHALIAAHANGMVGYVPTPTAFTHGGYETTFAPSSRLDPAAGDLLADAAVRLMHAHH